MGKGRGRIGEKVQGIRGINGRYKIDGEVKNSIGNGEAKELTCTTHGHELKGGRGCWWEGGAGQRGKKGRKKLDNCNSIINKIYIKNN